MQQYVAQPGDNLFRIARRFGVTVQAILVANPLITDPNVIFVGQIINIPITVPTPPPVTPGRYVVQRGDTLSAIARRFGVTLAALIAANPLIRDPNIIFIGQIINIPS